MRSIGYYHPGPATVLEVLNRSLPEPGDGQVRVRIVVAGVNPTDIDSRRRDPEVAAEVYVPGQDGAGVVDALGPNVDGFRPGDRVWVWDAAWQRAEGTAQEYVVLPARQLVPLPAHVSFDVGASLGIPALTAHRALTSFAEGPATLAPGALAGKVVLVAGGAGAVGNAAIQLAAWSGAEVISTVSDTDKAHLALAAGAHHVLNYRHSELREEIARLTDRGVDLIVEVNAHANIEVDMDIIAPHGALSIYTPGPGSTAIPSIAAMTKNVQVSFILTYTTTAQQKSHAVNAVSAAVDAGAFRVGEQAGLPLTRFPLDRAADAHTAVEDHTVGKVLLDVTTPDHPADEGLRP